MPGGSLSVSPARHTHGIPSSKCSSVLGFRPTCGGEIVSERRVSVWFRNPDNYVKELVTADHRQVVWDKGYLFKKRIDPLKHAELYFAGYPYRVMVVGNEEQGAAEYVNGCDIEHPVGVYPVVSMLQPNAIATLEELAANPSGENEDICKDPSVPADERPVFGQSHIIVVTDFPDLKTGRGRTMLRTVRDVGLDYPDAIIHIHGLYGWSALFGMGFKSIDYEARSTAQKGKIILPPGKEVKYEAGALLPQWITLLGFKPSELSIPANRCVYIIKSALWAADNFSESLNRRFRRDPNIKPEDVDTESSDADFTPATTRAAYSPSLPILPTDKVHCDSCSLTEHCKQYREGSVCTLDRDNKTLAQMFQTRDSETVLTGLQGILAKQADRAERAIEDEEEFGELNPDVTNMLNALFKNGVTYAKLVDPALRAGPKVAVQVNGAGAVTVGQQATPQQVMRDVFSAIEAQGIPRDAITPAMVRTMMERMYGTVPAESHQPAIEGSVG